MSDVLSDELGAVEGNRKAGQMCRLDVVCNNVADVLHVVEERELRMSTILKELIVQCYITRTTKEMGSLRLGSLSLSAAMSAPADPTCKTTLNH